ncbi:MAG: hypothetical protein ACLFR7_01525 [Opitutales bacterium]
MSSSSQKLDWCVVRVGEDMNWWVDEISDPVRWDVDGLSIIDPRQMSYVIDQCESLREYGFDPDTIEQAFFALAIEREEKDGRIRLRRTRESLLEDEASLFALPDVLDEEKGPYADFLDAITKSRVRMLNDQLDFEQNLTVEEIEEEIRERQNADYMEGKAVHFFAEVISILEYVPEGFEMEGDEDRTKAEDDDLPDLPDFDESADEKIEEDDTMKWDEDEEDDEKEEYDENERPDDFDEDPEAPARK